MKTIRSAAERYSACQDVASRRSAMEAVEERLRGECGMADDMVAHAIAPMKAEIALIEDMIARFDAASDGVMPPVRSLEDLGAVLIAARMALGESQREFGLRVGMGPGMVYKGETNGWGSVTLRHLSNIFSRLPLVLDVSARMEDGVTGEPGTADNGTLVAPPMEEEGQDVSSDVGPEA